MSPRRSAESRKSRARRAVEGRYVPPQGATLRAAHQLVHDLVDQAHLPTPQTCTARTHHADGAHLALVLADQSGWALWVQRLDPGHELHTLPSDTQPLTQRTAVGRLHGLRASVSVILPMGTDLLDPHSVRPRPPRGPDGAAGHHGSPRPTPVLPCPPRDAGVGSTPPHSTTEET